MNTLPLHILLVEDNAGDARLVREFLVEAVGSPPFTLDHAPDLASAVRRIERGAQPDVVLLDLSLPDSQGLPTLTRWQSAAAEPPVIVLTGFDDEASAINAVREGAQDYLVKGRIDGNLLHQAIRYAIERKRVQEALRRANETLERRVEERTAELREINARLEVEIAERKQAERQISGLLRFEQEARAAVEAANRSKDEFLATLSHELRTPLNAILGWSEILRTGEPSGPEVREGIEIIERNARAQARLVEDVLEVSRIICGKLRIHPRPIDLVQVVEAALASARPAAQAKSIVIQRAYEMTSAPAEGDSDRLQQVVGNLLSNAVKFTPAQGLVQVSLRRRHSELQVEVKDSGIGIRPDFLPYVFDRFRQSDSSSTRVHGGLGLGLSIARHLIEMHRGRIAVQSAGEGRGATFTITLPAAEETTPPDPPENRSAVAAGAGAGSGNPGLELPSLPGVRVLLVDDDADSRRPLARLLQRCRAEVREAASAAEAFAALEDFPADVLVSDLAMPAEDGYSLIRRLRASPLGRVRSLPALALSAFARPEDKARALTAGFQLHLPKPSEPVDILAAIALLAAAHKEPEQPNPTPALS